MTKTIVVTSGKGGVGKTTTSASIATGLAQRGFNLFRMRLEGGPTKIDCQSKAGSIIVFGKTGLIKQGVCLVHIQCIGLKIAIIKRAVWVNA